MMKLGVPNRKLRSLKFRAKRRAFKMRLSGDPFKWRNYVKNSNRQTAALKRQRDQDGKFVDAPIADKGKSCQIFQMRPDGPIFSIERCVENTK